MSIYTETDLKNLKADIDCLGIEKASLLWYQALRSAIVKAGFTSYQASGMAFDVVDEMVETIRGEA